MCRHCDDKTEACLPCMLTALKTEDRSVINNFFAGNHVWITLCDSLHPQDGGCENCPLCRDDLSEVGRNCVLRIELVNEVTESDFIRKVIEAGLILEQHLSKEK